jgi:fucose 4-O-acetylase-like acetyltransferase
MNNTIAIQRDKSFDAAKYMLIVFVVFGHMLETDTSLFVNARLRAFVYTFHMPSFILLSGYFFRKGAYFWKGILRLTLVWITFQISCHYKELAKIVGG